MTLDQVAQVLGGEVSGGQVLAPGPNHSAADRSLSIKLDDAAPEGFIVHSFADDDAVVCRDHVRKKLGLPEFKPKKGNSKAGNSEWKFIREHIYRTADGTPHLRKQKKIDPEGKRQFPQAHWSDGQWVNGVPKDWPKVLYRLPELLKAPLASPVFICEGEADSDALAALGFVATTAGGVSETKPWTKAEFIEPLKGRRVVIIVDSDIPGRAYGQRVARALDPIAEVKVVDLYPEVKNGRDVSDFLMTDRAGVNFVKAAKGAPLWEPSAGAGDEPSGEAKDDDAGDKLIAELAELPTVQYERRRKKAAEQLGVRAPILDRMVAAERTRLGISEGDTKLQGRAIEFPTPELWTEPVDGAALLDALAEGIGAHVVMSEHQRAIAALWCVHTHLCDRFLVSPRLAICSPVKQCGKTTLLDVLARLVLRPLPTANVTAAAIFRVVEEHRPSLLVDEADTFLHESDELRGVINSGHRRGGSVLRTVGDEHEVRAFSTYAACAIAAIGRLPDTLHDRSVVIDLKRRLRTEKISPFRIDRTGHLDDLARQIARWASDNAERIGATDPEMPDGVHNRAADNWRGLLAIAETAGGEWLERARAAASAAAKIEKVSRIEMLLGDVRQVFTLKDTDRLPSAVLVSELVALEGRPWAEYGKAGKPMTQNQLARALKAVGVTPEVVRIGDETARGYLLAQFDEAFSRYASSPTEGGSNRNSVTNADMTGTSELFQTVTDDSDVTVRKSEKSNNDGLCCGVTVWKGDIGEERHVEPSDGPPLPSGAEIVGRAPAGERCDLCGKASGVLQVRQPGGQILHLHRACAAKTKPPRRPNLIGS